MLCVLARRVAVELLVEGDFSGAGQEGPSPDRGPKAFPSGLGGQEGSGPPPRAWRGRPRHCYYGRQGMGCLPQGGLGKERVECGRIHCGVDGVLRQGESASSELGAQEPSSAVLCLCTKWMEAEPPQGQIGLSSGRDVWRA